MARKESGKSFYEVVSQLTQHDVDSSFQDFTPSQRELIKLSDKYSDENLARRFSKKKHTSEFFRDIDTDFFSKHVAPFVEKQMAACIDIVRNEHVPLFRKELANIHNEDKIEIQEGIATAVFNFENETDGFNYRLEIKHNNKVLPVLKRQPIVLVDSPCRMVLDNKLYFFRELSGKRILPFLKNESISIPAKLKEKYLKTFVLKIVGENEVISDVFGITKVESEKKAVISIEQGLRLEPILVLYFQYGKKHINAGRADSVQVDLANKNGHFVFYKHYRDFDWETRILAFLNEIGFDLIGEQLIVKVQGGEKIAEGNGIINWINEYSARLKDEGVEIRQNLPADYYTGSFKLEFKTRIENDWFDLYAVVRFDDFEVPFIYFKKNILSGKREFVLPNGLIAILPEVWFEKYADLLQSAKGDKAKLKLEKHHFHLLEQSGILVQEQAQEFEKINPLKFELSEPPQGLNAQFRKYQHEGYSWMCKLGEHKLGGCLADDMGLGKTLQTLALLLREKENAQSSKPVFDENGMGDLFAQAVSNKSASLVLVPTSLVHNWMNEIKKFTPQLKVFKYAGYQRKQTANLSGIVNYYDVIISTYGTMRNDVELFDKLKFNYIVLDESQNIKNADSKTYKAVCELNSEKKLVLTGTPIENSLSDLWAQLNFLNRGMLGSLKTFREKYIVPVEKEADEEARMRLFNLINPFLLRRTKEQVATDLPPLTEQISYCEMTEAQAELYEKEKSTVRNAILENIEKQGLAKSSIVILQGLTRLRQLANHPALIKNSEAGSGKFEQVMETIGNLVSEKHKVLVFSSFVTHLKLFEAEFERNGIGYCMLTGQTGNREEVINRFQNDKTKPVFLISLKAGGVGLNLTAADYIIILDPWWNPAAENQAVSRAHRIGQNKKVFVYRFISENSIEEKIQKLKERKSALADKFIQSRSPFSAVSETEIKELFD